MKFNPLNWKEIQLLAALLQKTFSGKSVQKIYTPKRSEVKASFYKHHYGLWFGHTDCLEISLRSGWVFLRHAFQRPVIFQQAAPSFFLQHLKKNLEGKKCLKIEAISEERFVQCHFSEGITLFIGLLPHAPQAYLQGPHALFISSHGQKALPSFQPAKKGMTFLLRSELTDLKKWDLFLESLLSEAAFWSRWEVLHKEVAHKNQALQKRLEQLMVQKEHSLQQKDLSYYGFLMQTAQPILKNKQHLFFLNHETQEKVCVPVDPKLDYFQQMQVFFQEGKRQKKQQAMLKSHIKSIQDKKAQHMEQQELLQKLIALDWEGLKNLEALLLRPSSEGLDPKKERQIKKGIGKHFMSSDGFSIMVGRNVKENCALTFQVANGNDIWLHLHAQKSAHAVILLKQHKNKSCSLEALLDASHVLLHFSGKSTAGKWDVDYTFKKYVKRIPKTDLVSYSQYKTLQVTWDEKRIHRLIKAHHDALLS